MSIIDRVGPIIDTVMGANQGRRDKQRRRENALRRQREDELEASTITGVTKRQGNLVQKSTRGF